MDLFLARIRTMIGDHHVHRTKQKRCLQPLVVFGRTQRRLKNITPRLRTLAVIARAQKQILRCRLIKHADPARPRLCHHSRRFDRRIVRNDDARPRILRKRNHTTRRFHLCQRWPHRRIRSIQILTTMARRFMRHHRIILTMHKNRKIRIRRALQNRHYCLVIQIIIRTIRRVNLQRGNPPFPTPGDRTKRLGTCIERRQMKRMIHNPGFRLRQSRIERMV